jgi:branched-chain amino acid transport system ATP-binding protein
MSDSLRLDRVSKHYGGLRAVSDVTAVFDVGQITAVIGPNGAGKTTLFSIIAGTVKPTTGRVSFRGHDITGVRPDRICRRGIARTFQIVRPFWNLDVRDHLRSAALFGGQRRGVDREIDHLLELTGLADRAYQRPSTLTLAACKRLEIARALATGARLLLLDETMAGLTPEETREAIALVRRVRDQGRGVILIEHVLAAVTDLCDRAIVLDSGHIIGDGSPAQVLASTEVKRAYLGIEN